MTRSRRTQSALAVPALIAVVAGTLTSLLVAAPAYAATFTNAAAISVADATCGTLGPPIVDSAPGKATPYPSQINVSGLVGTVSDVNVTLTDANGFSGDFEVVLVAPGGQNLVLVSDAGTANLSNRSVTFDDSAPGQLASTGTWSATAKPTDNLTIVVHPNGPADSYPSPAPASPNSPGPTGSATLASVFNGLAAPNGNWSLYVLDDGCGDSIGIAGGWSLDITMAASAVATSTALTSTPNPSATGGNVTFTAAVTSSSTVNAGTVTFTEGATTLAGPTAVDATGHASFSTTALAEGSHLITATYNGTASFASSNGSTTQQVDNPTTQTGNTYCNTGAITIPASGTATPYPSHISVGSFTGNIGSVAVQLKNFTHNFSNDVDVLLVGPTGANLLVVSDAGGPNATSNVTATFSDTAASGLPSSGGWGAPNTSVIAQPTDFDSVADTDTFPSPAPAVSANTTLGGAFGNTSPVGQWSLYVVDDSAPDGGSIAGGWCITLIPRTTVVIEQAAGQPDPTGASPINFTATFNQSVTGFTGSDISFAGSTVGGALSASISGMGSTYTVSVTGMTTPGTVVVSIPADSVSPSNDASTSTDNSVTWDNVAPTVTINQAAAQSDPATTSPINFTATFSEPVTGFTGSDISFAGSTAGGTLSASISGTGPTYTVSVTGMTTGGTVIASIPAGSATDAAGNGNTASTSADHTVTWISDSVAPTVTVNQAAGQADPTGASPINFTVVFSEPVTGFTAADISFAGSTVGGTLAASVSGPGPTYTVSVTGMTTPGTVVVSIPAAAATDLASNPSEASTSADNSVTWDNVAPTVTVNQAAGQADPTSTSPINFTVVFSEPVTGFTAADVSFAGSTVGGTLAASVSGPGPTYTVSVTGMTGTGTVVVSIPAGSATDAAGNPNAASTSTDNSVTFATDLTPPTVTVNQAAGQADPTSTSPINFTVVFSEPVTGFTAADVSFAGSTAGGTLVATVSGPGPTYTVAVTGMTTAGTVVVSIPANAATDLAGNPSAASTSTDNTVTWQAGDTTPPTCAITAVRRPGPSGRDEMDVTVRDTGSGLQTITNIVITNGTATITPSIPFAPGVTQAVLTAVKTTQGVSTSFSFDVVDRAGNVKHCS